MNLNKTDMAQMVKGACIMASGGGGSYVVATQIIAKAEPVPVRVIDQKEVSETDWVAVSANMGSPDALFKTANPYAGSNAIKSLEQYCKYAGSGDNQNFHGFTKFSHILPIELGAINTATPLAVAAQLGLNIIDGDGAGRSIPELQLTTFVRNIPMGPIVLASESNPKEPYNSAVLSLPDEITAEAAIIGTVMTTPFEGIAGLGIYAMNGKTMAQYPVWGGLTDAIMIGRIYEATSGEVRVNRILNYLNTQRSVPRPSEIILHGHVTKISQSSGGVDIGYIVITEIGKDNRKLWIYNENENLYAQFEGESLPVVLPPDSICYIPAAADQVPFDNSDLNNIMSKNQTGIGPEIYVVKIKADRKMQNAPIPANFEAILRQRGYAGPL